MRTLSDLERRPRVIIGASRAAVERATKLGGRSHHISVPDDAELCVVDPYKPPPQRALVRMIEEGLLAPGTVLVLSPFGTGAYAPEAEAELAFEREKLQLVSQLCQLLGATRVTSETQTLRVESTETSARAKAQKKLGRVVAYGGEASLTFKDQEQWQHRLQVDDTYPGGVPDLEAARGFIELHSLSDPEISSLVDARSGPNGLMEREITVVYEGSRDRSLDVAAKVQLPVAAMDGQVRRTHKTRRRVSLKLRIRF